MNEDPYLRMHLEQSIRLFENLFFSNSARPSLFPDGDPDLYSIELRDYLTADMVGDE